MRYRVRGPLHSDITHIATELRGFIAHTGPIRLGYLQMHGVAAHTIDVSDNGAAFFEETVLPKIGATGSFVEQRTALRQPKELKLTATLCPTTATALPNLTEWAGVWSEVVYGPRRATVRLRCLPEDAGRLRELEDQGWRVLRGPAALLAWLTKAAPFVPQFWPSRAGCAASPAKQPSVAELPDELPAAAPEAAELAPPAKVSSLTATDVVARPDTPNLLLGVTPTGQGVRLAWRAMIVAVQDGGRRQDTVISAMLFRALTQGMGALVIAERSKVTPRALASLAKRLRVIDMADPWESARIPWRSLPPEGLKLLLGGDLPSPLPETLPDALRAVGRRNLATPVVEALTREPAHDLAGTMEAGGGVVLLVEPGASASFLASLLILSLSLARYTRPLMICRPASLPMPSALADRAVQIVFGDAPTAAIQLQAEPDSWLAIFPDGQRLTLQENLAAPVEEQAGADHAALMNGLQGHGWTPEEAAALAVAPGQLDESAGGLGWPEELDEGDEGASAPQAAYEAPAGMGWPEELDEGDEAAAELTDADEPAAVVTNDELAVTLATDVTPGASDGDETAPEGAAGLGWPEELDEGDEAAGIHQSAYEAPAGLGWPEELDEAAQVAADEGLEQQDASELFADELTLLPADEPAPVAADELAPLATDEGLEQQDASEVLADEPALLPADELAQVAADEGLEQQDASEVLADEPALLPADELAPVATDEDLEQQDASELFADEPALLPADELAPVATDEGLEQQDASEASLLGDDEEVPWEPVIDLSAAPSFDVDTWAAALLDDDELFRSRKPSRRRRSTRRGRVSFTPSAHAAASVGFERQSTNAVPALVAADELAQVAADEGLEQQDASEALADEPALLPADEPALVAADEGLEQQDASELFADELTLLPADELALVATDEGLEQQDASEVLADELAPLPADESAPLAADELAPLASDEGLKQQDASEALADEPALLPADKPAPVATDEGLKQQDALEASADRLTSLVAAWRGGASLTVLARELRSHQPGLSLLEATQVLKAAIHSEEMQQAAEPNVLKLSPAAVPDGLVTMMRNLAAAEPAEPVAQEVLRQWREGGQRRLVVRDLMVAHRMREADARALYDRVILPHVIADLNGSADAVVRFLREPEGNQEGDLPPVVVNCVARLVGSTRTHIGMIRPLLPGLREALTLLDEERRA